LAVWGVNEIFILFGAGFVAMFIYVAKHRPGTLNTINVLAFLPLSIVSATSSDWKIFWIFLKVGAILYGSGYVLFAFLDSELVKTGMLSRQTLVDAIAVGQFTPGPVFSSATFIGWQMDGIAGAAKATVGIFLPSFLFVGFLNPLVAWLRKSKAMSAFLDAVNIAAIALISAVCVEMGKESVTDWKTILILVTGIAVTLAYKKLNSAFVIIGGAAVGYLLWLI